MKFQGVSTVGFSAEQKERITFCVDCKLNKYEVCCGKKITFESDYRHDRVVISECYGSNNQYKEIAVIKGETYCLQECKNWLAEKGYKISEFLACRDLKPF